MINKSFARRSLGRAILAATLVVGVSALSPLMAEVIPVSDMLTETNTGLTSKAVAAIESTSSAEAADIKSLLAYLEGVTGPGSPNGIVALTSANGDQLSRINNFNDQYFANAYQTQTSGAAAGQIAQYKLERYGPALELQHGATTNQACEDVSAAGGYSRGVTTADAGGKDARLTVDERMTDNRGTLGPLADTLKNVPPFCSANDKKFNRPNCAAGAGPLPNADMHAFSLNHGAVNENGTEIANQTLDTPLQVQASNAFLTNLMPLPAPQPRGDAASQTQVGKIALAQFRRYNSSMSTASDALISIQAGAKKMPQAPSTWAQDSALWKKVFPGVNAPSSPSEDDFLNLEVYKYVADPDTINRIKRDDTPGVLKDLSTQIALGNVLTLRSIRLQEQQTEILAALLHNSMDPITRASLEAALPQPSQNATSAAGSK